MGKKSEPTRQLIVKLDGIVLLVGVFEVVLVVGVSRTPTSLTSVTSGHVEPDGLVRVEDGVVPAPVTEVQADVDHTGKGVGVPEVMAYGKAVLRCDI